MKKIFFYITFFFLNITICSTQNVQNYSFTDIANNPKKIIKHYEKDVDTESDHIKYKLALAYYITGVNKKNGKDKYFTKALNLFKPLENNEQYKVNSLFRQGQCNIGLFKLDLAYKNFSDLISINPLMPEAYYFKAFSFYYSKNYSTRTNKDTLEYFQLINEMNQIIQITNDTNKLKFLAEATHNLKNFLPQYPVFDGISSYKTFEFINHDKYYFQMGTSLIYDLDSLPYSIINKSIYELYSCLQLVYFDTKTDSFDTKTVSYEKLLQYDNIHNLLDIPDSLTIDSFQMSIMKVNRGYKVKGDTLNLSGNTEIIYLQSYSSSFTKEMLEAITKLTIYDKIYFEKIYTTKIKNGYIPPAIGRLEIINNIK